MSHAIALWEYALWGAFGGVAVEAIEILGAVNRTKGLPWNQPGEITLGALLFTVLVRLGLGAGLALALGEGGQISGGVGAVAAGVAAPLILEQLGKQLSSGEVNSERRAEVRVIDEEELRGSASKQRAQIQDYVLRHDEDRRRGAQIRDYVLRHDEERRRWEGREATPHAPNMTAADGIQLVSFARKVAFGLARSTPAFGGTAEL